MKKGFTLVELLAVLVVLGILAAITTPIISRTIKNNRNALYEDAKASVIQAAKNWGAENMYLLPTTLGGVTEEYDGNMADTYGKLKVRLDTLQTSGFINEKINNPKGGTFCNKAYVTITKVASGFTYEIAESDEEVLNLTPSKCREK